MGPQWRKLTTIFCASALATPVLLTGCQDRQKASDLDVDLRRRSSTDTTPETRRKDRDDRPGSAAVLDMPSADAAQPPAEPLPSTTTDSKASGGSPTGATSDANRGAATARDNNSPESHRGSESLPPVFTGSCPRRIASTAEDAVQGAKRRLAEARSASRKGDGTGAVEAATQAFEIASEYATDDSECEELAKQASALIDSLGRRFPAAQSARTEFR